jgi:hypothetical protein
MFEQSESIAALAKALLTFHGEVGKVKKDANNPFFKSKYASLSNILDAIEEPLQKAGLAVSQFPTEGNGLVTQVMHSSGEWMRCSYVMPVKEQNNPQAVGSSITYARRYALAAALSLNIDEDDDGNAAAGPAKKAPVPVSGAEAPQPFSRDESEKPTVTGVLAVTTKEMGKTSTGKEKATLVGTATLVGNFREQGDARWQALNPVTAWKNAHWKLHEGGAYKVVLEVGEFRGETQYTVSEVLETVKEAPAKDQPPVPDMSELPF